MVFVFYSHTRVYEFCDFFIYLLFCDIKSYLFTFMHLTGMIHPSDDSFYSIFIEIAANLSISGG